MKLTNIEYLKRVLAESGARPRRSAGQNFLICEEPIDTAVDLLADGPRMVTELGAGAGPLTQELLANGFHVRAIERDTMLADLLRRLLSEEHQERFELHVGDLREASWEWNEPYQIAGNIPYNLSGLILRRITQLSPQPERVVLMVQKEVGERVTATPPNMSLVSVAVQLWGEAREILTVPPSCFWPQPQVTSALIELVPHMEGVDLTTRENIIKTAKTFFQARRKQLGGVLAKNLHLSMADAHTLLKKSGIEPTQRPQELSLKQWQDLFSNI